MRAALSIGLFDHLPHIDEKGASAGELSTLTETDMLLVERLLRALVAFNIVHQDEENRLYRHTGHSLVYTQPSRRAWAIWMWDVMVQSAAAGVGPYFDRQSKPIEAKHGANGETPFTVAHGVDASEGSTVFDVIQKIGKTALMKDAMSGSSAMCAREAIEAFDFAALKPGENDVVLVDVGGARGATILELRRSAGVKGKLVLQDLGAVLSSVEVGTDAEVMDYDFFKQEQPVKGAGAYYYQRIFHDWSDEDAEKILDSLRPAMSRHSKLLICDVVLEDVRPHPRKILRDMNMALVGGMERTQGQWQSLLERKGFAIDTIHGLRNPVNSIIEARLA